MNFLQSLLNARPAPLAVAICSTGLGEDDEVREIAIANLRGELVFRGGLAPPDAGTRQAQEDWRDLWRGVAPLLRDRWLVSYCAERTRRLLEQTGSRRGLPVWISARWACVEDVLAPILGTGPEAQADAFRLLGVQQPSEGADAIARVDATVRLFLAAATNERELADGLIGPAYNHPAARVQGQPT